MAVSQAGFVEKIIGHTDDANTEKYADPSGKKMKAMVWIFYKVSRSSRNTLVSGLAP